MEVLQAETPPGQIALGVVLLLTVFIVLFAVEKVAKGSRFSTSRFAYLIDYTANGDEGPVTIYQNPIIHPNEAKTIGMSENERTGIEFAYSFYMMVQPNTFTGEAGLKHVFHKGYQCAWPLMGPGVFMRADTNVMRVIMNGYDTPYHYCDIPNIPLKKWLHVVLNCYQNALEVYINGNIVNRINFTGSMPYQNFGDIYVFNNANYVVRLPDNEFRVQGTTSGYISNLTYARYALSFTEIQSLMNNGPSKRILQRTDQDKNNLPPYLADSWWTSGV
jgi:hypothetical protein